jgi:hypothetical protein
MTSPINYPDPLSPEVFICRNDDCAEAMLMRQDAVKGGRVGLLDSEIDWRTALLDIWLIRRRLRRNHL